LLGSVIFHLFKVAIHGATTVSRTEQLAAPLTACLTFFILGLLYALYMKQYWTLFVCLLVFACRGEVPLEDEADDFPGTSHAIELDSFSTYGELMDYLYELACERDDYLLPYPSVLLSRKGEAKLYLLPPDCEGDIACYKERNVLLIRKVSELSDEQLRAHIMNYGKLKRYSEEPHKAVIALSLEDETSIEDVRDIGIKLVNFYGIILNENSQAIFGQPLQSLSIEELSELKEQFPFLVKLWNRNIK
jgi:hypothetical protein